MTSYERFQDEFSKNKNERIPIKIGRRLKYMITKEKLSHLFDNYFKPINFEEDYTTYIFLEDDLPTILAILRGHFKLWVEVDKDTNCLNVFKSFPKVFIVIKEINKENHWFIDETIEPGTILHLGEDDYGIVNWLNGIPLIKNSQKIKELGFSPVMQINYGYVKSIY